MRETPRCTARHDSCLSRQLADSIGCLGGELEKLETDRRTRGVRVDCTRELLQGAALARG